MNRSLAVLGPNRGQAALFLLLSLLLDTTLTHAQAADALSDLLLGRWAATETSPSGVATKADINFQKDMQFTGSLSANGVHVWDYAGTWSVKENTITWHYETSSRPMPDAAKTDIDEIVLVDQAKLILLSKSTGVKHSFDRTK